MRILRQDRDWWVIDVPPYDVDGETFTSVGPYATKAEASEAKRGMAEFLAAHPEYETDSEDIFEFPATSAKKHWFARSVQFRPNPVSSRKQVPSAEGQLPLPGFESDRRPQQ